MSLLHPSRITRSFLKIASFGLAGLLTGCTSAHPTHLLHNDTDWQTSSTYASATASMPPRAAVRTARPHPCMAGPCVVHSQSAHPHPLHHL